MRGRLALLALLAVVAAGCGGGGGGGGTSGGGTVPSGASVVPASAPVFISVDTDFESDQWKQAAALAKRFPDLLPQLEKSLRQENVDFERDVKPALGPESDLVLLDFANGGNDVVALTRPRDKAKLDALLAKGTTPPAHQDVDGWTVLADKMAQLDGFRQARSSGSLADDQEFRDVMEKLPAEALARVYVAGARVQSALDAAIARGGAPPAASGRFGTLTALALAAAAHENGISLDGRLDATFEDSPDAHEAELPSELPAGALLYFSFHGLDRPLGRVLDAVRQANPQFRTQLDQVQGVTGLTLEGDVLPLFSGEGALAVYPSTQALPTIELVLKVPDEGKARALLDRIGSLATAAGESIQTVDVSGVQAHELAIPGQPFSIVYAVFDGKLVVSNARDAISGLRSSGARLEADPLYKAAAAAAELPDETVGLAYANLRDGLPYAFGLAQSRGATVPEAARENIRPLDAAILFGTKDGKAYRIGGFLTTKQ